MFTVFWPSHTSVLIARDGGDVIQCGAFFFTLEVVFTGRPNSSLADRLVCLIRADMFGRALVQHQDGAGQKRNSDRISAGKRREAMTTR